MGHLCEDGEEHVATGLLPLAEAGMVDADGLIPSSVVLAALKVEAMEPDVGHLCALLGEDRIDDDEYVGAEGHVIGDSRQ
eukprot:3271686-Pleurochrysis_carterae.AAC.1